MPNLAPPHRSSSSSEQSPVSRRRPFPDDSHSLFDCRWTLSPMTMVSNACSMTELPARFPPLLMLPAPSAPAEKHDWSDAEELIPSQLSFKGKAYGRHHDRKMLNDNSGCKPKVHSHTRGAFSHLLLLVMLHIEPRSLVL